MNQDTSDTRQERRRRWKTPAEAHGAVLIGMLAVSLIFGNAFVAATLLGVVAVFAVLSALNSTFKARFTQFSQTPSALSGSSMLVGALALAGIFGNPLLMTLVILLAGLAVLFLAISSSPAAPHVTTPPIPNFVPVPAAVAPALPAQAQGEKISELDVRALCRGLPPMQAGQVMTTVEELELAVAEAQRRGNVKAAFDARQALTDYLPGTVEAWKAQAQQDRRLEELDQALNEVRAIAGTSDGSAQRRAWETQQRFLRSRGPQGESTLTGETDELKKT